MTTGEHAVTVVRLAETSTATQQRAFLDAVWSQMSVDRPRMVIDCSGVSELGSSVLRLLLQCLEEAMKRNGDVKLAALPPGAAETLEAAGAGRIFHVYKTTADAVNSFQSGAAAEAARPVGKPENAA